MEIAVGPVEAIPEGGVRIVQSGSLFVGVYRIDGELYAIEDRCSHDDGPLCEGERDGFCVVCPRHGARFDLRTGAVLSLPATENIKTFKIVMQNNKTFVIA